MNFPRLRSSVRGRLLYLVVAIIVPAAVLVSMLTLQGYRNQRASVSQHMLATARAVAATIDMRIAENRALLIGLSAAPSLAAGDIDAFAEAIDSLQLGAGRWIVLADANGQQLINPELPKGSPLPRNPVVAEHERTISAGNIYISNVITGRVGRLVMFVSTPVFIEGKHQYTLTYVTEPFVFAEALRAMRIPPELVVAVLDRNGTIAARVPDIPQSVGEKAVPDMVTAVMTGFEGVRETQTLDSRAVLAAISRAPQSGWSVAIGASHANIYAPARRMLWMGLGLALLLVAIAAAIAVWIGRSVVSGVESLVADTEAIGRGEMPRPYSSGLDDTDLVAKALRKMAEQLQERDRENAALYYLVERVNRAAALPEIYDAALDAVLKGHGANRAGILICDDRGVMRFKASRGLSAPYCRTVEGHNPRPNDGTRLTPRWFDDVATANVDGEVRRTWQREGIAALAIVPLWTKDQLLGQLTLYYNQPHRFTAAELRPMETLASQIAFAIERQTAAEELESLVDERTASLRAAVAQMEEFSYSVSHDLRAPIRAISGYTESLLEDYARDWAAEPRELLTRIERSSRRMDRMIQDLLSFTRVTRAAVHLERVSLAKLIEDVCEHYPEIAAADFAVETPLPDVIASEPLLVQVISNLLTNAVKFVRPGTRPHVRVGGDLHDGRARFWIRDNGIGIKPELQGRLFQMFERVHTDRGYEGTGIGLAIVRKALERMDGSIVVESNGHTGTTFVVELPAASETNVVTTRENAAHGANI